MVRFFNENRTSKARIYGFWETKSSGSPGYFRREKKIVKIGVFPYAAYTIPNPWFLFRAQLIG